MLQHDLRLQRIGLDSIVHQHTPRRRRPEVGGVAGQLRSCGQAVRRMDEKGVQSKPCDSAKRYATCTVLQACEQDGIRYEVREVAREEVDQELQRCNEDPDVHGMVLRLHLSHMFVRCSPN
jgi:hypothetical protein